MFTNLNYVGIIVTDVAEATAFYRDTLGFTLEGASQTMAQFETQGGAILGIQQLDLPGEQPFEPAFMVEDVDATYAAWKARGVEMIVGGGAVTSEIRQRFVELAGGPHARIVVIPAVDPRQGDEGSWLSPWRSTGAQSPTGWRREKSIPNSCRTRPRPG